MVGNQDGKQLKKEQTNVDTLFEEIKRTLMTHFMGAGNEQ